jgi:sialic acid synthase SpsE
MPTLVIVEAGSCHDGDLERMLWLVNAAAYAHANVFKVQFWSDPDVLADRRRVPAVYREIYRRYRMPVEWFPAVRARCRDLGLALGVSTYLPQDVAVVDPFTDVFKVASFEADAQDLLRAIDATRGARPLVISLGLGASRWSLRSRPHTSYLRCVTAYPAPVEDLHLAQLYPCHDGEGLCDCPHLDGLSDHTDPALTWTGALAVAAGAEIVEAHLRLVETDPQNPDAPHAMVPDQFRAYVQHIRFAEVCRGDGGEESRVLPCEQPLAAYKVRTT